MADATVAPGTNEGPATGAHDEGRAESGVLAPAADQADDAGDTRLKMHVVEFCGGMGSLVGEHLDEMLRLHPERARPLRLAAVDTCINDNRMLHRTRRSPWLRTLVLGQSVTNFHAVFREREKQWKGDLPLPFLQSRRGIPGCKLKLSGVNKRPVIAAALNAMEREYVERWLAATDASFDQTDRTLTPSGREASYVAGTGGTGLASAIMHAGWRSQLCPGVSQRLVVLGPEVYPISGDPQRDRRHKLIMAAAAWTLDRLVLLGTDPEHPHFGGPLPGFSENLEPGFISQIVLIEGRNNQNQTISFEDAQVMAADYLYYLSQVPQLASFLAVQLHEDMAKDVPAAMRTPFVWSSPALHVCELWQELPRVAALGRRAAALNRMREGAPGGGAAVFAPPMSESGIQQTIAAWERRIMSEAASEFAAPIFDQIRLRSAILAAPAATGVAVVASIRSIPAVADRHLSESGITGIAGRIIAGMRTRACEAILAQGMVRFLDTLIRARVSLGSPEEFVPQTVDHFMSPGSASAISAGAGIVEAQADCARAMAIRPGFWRGLLGMSCPEIEGTRASAGEALNTAVSSALDTDSRIAGMVLYRMLEAKMAKIRGLVCAELDAEIALFTAARDELAAEEGRARAEIRKMIAEGRAKKLATRLSLFPDDAVMSDSASADASSVESAFGAMFSLDGSSGFARTERALGDILDSTVSVPVAFDELFMRHPDARHFIADHLRESEPFIRINERGLQGLEGVTRRCALVCPRSLAGFVESLTYDRDAVHVFYADIPAVFVLKQVDTLPSSAIASLCEYDALLADALESEARERNDSNQSSGFTETLAVFPLGRYRHAPRTNDTETERWHRRVAAALLLNPDIAQFDSANPDTAWARLSVVTEQGARVPILGPDEPMHPECPLFQDPDGVWHIRFINHLGGAEKRSLGTRVLAYALDMVSRHKRYQAAIVAWIERCATAANLDCGIAAALAVSEFANWCAYAQENIANDRTATPEAIRTRSLLEAVDPTANMVCKLAEKFFEPDEWFLDFGVRYPNQVMHPARAAAAGNP